MGELGLWRKCQLLGSKEAVEEPYEIPSRGFPSVAHLVVGSKDEENFGSHFR